MMDTENQIEIDQADDGSTQSNVQFEQETVWLKQAQMAELFDKGRTTITEHINNVFSENELLQEAPCRKFRQVRTEGNRIIEREIEHYNLDVIISVGYRVQARNTIPNLGIQH